MQVDPAPQPPTIGTPPAVPAQPALKPASALPLLWQPHCSACRLLHSGRQRRHGRCPGQQPVQGFAPLLLSSASPLCLLKPSMDSLYVWLFVCAGRKLPPVTTDLDELHLLRMRRLAVKCWDQSYGEIGPAAALFRQTEPKHGIANVSQFIRTWVDALDNRFSLLTPAGPGANPKLSDADVARCIELLWAGYHVKGVHRLYKSIQHAATHNRGIKSILAKAGGDEPVKPMTLLKRMKAADARVRLRTVAMKRQHTAASKAARCNACRQLLLWDLYKLQRVCWIDAATIQVVPEDVKVYAPPDCPGVVTDPRLPSHSSYTPKLKFYICINAILGAVALEFVTGTTGLQTDDQWLVRATPAALLLPCGTVAALLLPGSAWLMHAHLTHGGWQGMSWNSIQNYCWGSAATAGWQRAHAWPSWHCPGGVSGPALCRC